MADGSDISENSKYLIGLAQLRQVLVIDRNHVMPKHAAAAQQRRDVLDAVESVIDAELRVLGHPFPQRDVSAPYDHITETAWDYLLERQHQITNAVEPPRYDSAHEHLQAIYAELGKLGEAEVVLDYVRGASFPNKQALFPEHAVLNDVIGNAAVALELAKYKISSDPAIGPLLGAAKQDMTITTEIDQQNLRLMNASYVQANGLSGDLVARVTQASDVCREAFAKAKATNNFDCLEGPLNALITVLREKGTALGEQLGLAPYDALLGERNPGLVDAAIQPIFRELEEKLPPLIKAIQEKQANEEVIPLPEVPIRVREKVIRRVLEAMGFDPNKSVLGQAGAGGSFAEGSWDDSRLVAGLNQKNILDGLMGAIHENGHRLYFSNLPQDKKYQPVSQWQSNWIHETQAMFWERGIAGSLPFMKFLSGVLQDELRKDPSTSELANDPAFLSENLYRMVTRLNNAEKLRVKADGVQYPLHVSVQSRIEKALLEGRLTAAEVPALRNDLMDKLLGLDTKGDITNGPAQDNHWTYGNYFPPYALGILGQAQLLKAYTTWDSKAYEKVERGEFEDAIRWLSENVHSKGSLYSGQKIIEDATGKPLSAADFLEMIETRYLEQPNPRSGHEHALQFPESRL